MAKALTQEQLSKIEQFSPEQRDLFIKRLEEEGQTQNFIERAQATKQQEQKQTTPEVPTTPATPSPVTEEPQVDETQVRVPETPKQEEAPVRTTPTTSTQTTETQQTTQKATPTIDRNLIRQAFEVGAARGLDVNETIENIKWWLENKGIDTSTFEQDNETLISTFSQFNNSPDSFFVWLQQGETYGKVVQESASYKIWKQLFDKWNAQDKSEEGIYLSLKNEKIDPTVLNEMKKDPELSQRINNANKRIVTEEALSGNFSNLYSLPVGQQFDALSGIMEQWGLSTNYSEMFEQDNTLSTSSEAYTTAVWELEKLYKERENIRSKIDAKYPNSSEAFKGALYNRESQAIQDKINELEAQASTYKTTYDFRLGEIKAVADLEEVQNERKYEVFTQLRERNFDLYLEEIQNDKELANKFSFLSPWSGVVASTNKETWEVIFYNSQNVNIDSNTGSVETITTSNGVTIWGQGYDFRNSDYVSQYPRNASFKNNNPAGLTFTATSQKLKNLFDSAWIGYSEWTNRPEEEGWSYISFDNLSDWLSAMKLSFYNTGWTDVKTRLMAWKWAGTEQEKEAYVNDILRDAFGSTNNLQFSDMSSLQKEQLLVSHLKREDSALYSVLKDEIGAIENNVINYNKLVAKATSSSNSYWEVNLADVASVTLEAFWQRASDGERETVQLIFESMPWATAEEVLLKVKRFNFDNKEQQDFGNSLLRTARVSLPLWEIDAAWYASLIKSWNEDLAVNKMENEVDVFIKNKEGENYFSESVTKSTFEKVNELNNLISELNKIWDEPLGWFEWTVQQWLGRFRSGEAAQVAAKANLLITRMRKDLIGANITATEANVLEPNIPRLWDSTINFLIKTQSLKDDALVNLNNQRERYSLAKLNEDALFNLNDRVKLYNWEEIVENEIGNVSPIWPQQELNEKTVNPVKNYIGWAAGGIISAPWDTISLLTFWQEYIDISDTQEVINAVLPISWVTNWEPLSKSLKWTPSWIEILNRILPSALEKSWLDISDVLWVKDNLTVSEIISQSNANLTKDFYNSIWVDWDALSTKVWEFLWVPSLYGSAKWLSKTFSKIWNKTVWEVNSKIDKKITDDFISAIKPSQSSLWNSKSETERYLAKAKDSVYTIVTRKEELTLTNEAWEVVKNKIPHSINQFNEATQQIKRNIYEEYSEISKTANIKTEVNYMPIIKELETLKTNRVFKDMPESQSLEKYIDSIISSFKENWWQRSILDAEELKKSYNSKLDAFYRNPTTNDYSKSNIDALVNNLIWKQLDDTILSATWDDYAILKNQYWALRTIEKDINHRAIIEARKWWASITDHASILTVRDTVAAIGRWDIVRGWEWVATEWFKAVYKYINSPDRKIKNMFNAADKVIYDK